MLRPLINWGFLHWAVLYYLCNCVEQRMTLFQCPVSCLMDTIDIIFPQCNIYDGQIDINIGH